MLSTDLEVFGMYCHNVDKITADDILYSEDDDVNVSKIQTMHSRIEACVYAR